MEKTIKPRFGTNYDIGHIGFTFYPGDIVSEGIAYFSDAETDVEVSHTLLVSGKDECIEAHIKNGVQISTLSKYFDDPRCQIFFKKPVGLNPELARRMIETAKEQVGCEYDTSLIIAQALQGSFLGRLINKVFNGKPDEYISDKLDSDGKWICSEFMAYDMDSQPEFKDKGILAKPDNTIDPQELFDDKIIFKQWKKGVQP